MIEEQGDLFALAREADALVITTNGTIKKNWRAVMGRGCAREALQLWPGLDLAVAVAIRATNNGVFVFRDWESGHDLLWPRPLDLVIFPVKHHWPERADLKLIAKSTQLLEELAISKYASRWERVVMPRPGCGNGGLLWEDVKPIVSDLDDRFVAVTWPEPR